MALTKVKGSVWDSADNHLAISVRDYGATGDGTTDDSSAFQAAINAAATKKQRVVVPSSANPYILNSSLTMATGVRLHGEGDSRPILKTTNTSSALIFDFSSVNNSGLIGLEIDGNNAVTPAGYNVLLSNAVGNVIENCSFTNLGDNINGGIILSGTSYHNKITGNTCTDAAGSFVGLTGSTVHDNDISGNNVTDSVGFGIFLGGGAYNNLISGNRTISNGIELIGLTRGCFRNRIIGNHAEGCGDNGISVSGDHNVVSGNTCVGNDLAGIWSWGSYNSITGNLCLNNNQSASTWGGIGVSADFGGAGQHNVISGNVCDDNQAVATQHNGIRLINNAYDEWTTTTVVAAASYAYYGLNIYYTTAGGTTGGTAPTHTSGSVSDGGVTWTYIASFDTVASPAYNVVSGNKYGRSVSADIYDQFPAYNNVIDGLRFNSTVDSLVLTSGFTKHRTGVGANYTVLTSDHLIGVTDTSAPRTITLPNSGRLQGMEIIVADESGAAGTNNITINGNGSNINGAATATISTNYGEMRLYWTGSQWKARS